MKRATLCFVLLLVAASFLPTHSVLAFKSLAKIGGIQGAPIHETLTREALVFLKPNVLDTIVAQHALVDQLGEDGHQTDSIFHFDGCEFQGTTRNINHLYTQVVTNLNPADQSTALLAASQTFGQLLHPVQDFYAHSNWVELGLPGLIDSGLSSWEELTPLSKHNNFIVVQGENDDLTAKGFRVIQRDYYVEVRTLDNQLIGPGLVSGTLFYSSDDCPDSLTIPHGLPTGLNKDELTPSTTSRFPVARALAVRQTTHEWCRLVSLVKAGYGQEGVDALFNEWVENEQAATKACSPILIDQGHSNYYSLAKDSEANYADFVAKLQKDGYTIDSSSSPSITLEALASYSAFIIPLAATPPTPAEIAVLQQYVEQGGSVLLIVDWGGIFSNPSQSLANAFGVSLDASTIFDDTNFLRPYNYWVTYNTKNFSSHEIMEGINSIQSFAATGMLPGSATPLIITDNDARPANRATAVAVNYGAGKVVIIGDSNIFGYLDLSYRLDGLSYANNGKFASNVAKWLTTGSDVVLPDSGLYFSDADNNPVNWASTGTWTVTQGSSTSIVAQSRTSDNNNLVWTDSSAGNYENNANSALTSVAINLANTKNPQLSFSNRFDLEAGADYGYVEVSTDGGTSWQNVATFTGTSATWRTENVGLRNYAHSANLQIRFRFASNATIVRDGWSIDNVKIFDGPLILGKQLFLPVVQR